MTGIARIFDSEWQKEIVHDIKAGLAEPWIGAYRASGRTLAAVGRAMPAARTGAGWAAPWPLRQSFDEWSQTGRAVGEPLPDDAAPSCRPILLPLAAALVHPGAGRHPALSDERRTPDSPRAALGRSARPDRVGFAVGEADETRFFYSGGQQA